MSATFLRAVTLSGTSRQACCVLIVQAVLCNHSLDITLSPQTPLLHYRINSSFSTCSCCTTTSLAHHDFSVDWNRTISLCNSSNLLILISMPHFCLQQMCLVLLEHLLHEMMQLEAWSSAAGILDTKKGPGGMKGDATWAQMA